ncbi:MAG: nucleotide exchange factor GrpE [Anaerovoracaceae bacterium]
MTKKKEDILEEENLKQAETLEEEAEKCQEDKEEKVDIPKEKKEEEKKEPEEDENTKYMRLMADFQNYKKRSEKEKGNIYAFANEKMSIELLAVMDNFERALEHEAKGNENFKEGMTMIFKQLNDLLKKTGVVEIPALGEEFDPNFHNAVLTEDSEELDSNKITAVMQKGYTLNGKVIRPSMVKVAN